MVRQEPPGRARDSHTLAAWNVVAWLPAEKDAPSDWLRSPMPDQREVDHLALALAPACMVADRMAALQQKNGLARQLAVYSPACHRRHRTQRRAQEVARS